MTNECLHDPWLNDELFIPDEVGGGWLLGVYIRQPRECRRCGHLVTLKEALAAALGEIKEEMRHLGWEASE